MTKVTIDNFSFSAKLTTDYNCDVVAEVTAGLINVKGAFFYKELVKIFESIGFYDGIKIKDTKDGIIVYSTSTMSLENFISLFPGVDGNFGLLFEDGNASLYQPTNLMGLKPRIISNNTDIFEEVE